MDKQQGDQRYVDLIERLLTCPVGQEEAVLRTDAERVDAGLVAMMRQMATEMFQQGKENAVWLMQFAGQVAQKLGLERAENNPPENLEQFLYETLQLVAKSQGDARQVYPFLVLHQDYLNEQLLQWLPTLAARWLGGEPEQQQGVAAALGGFGNLIQKFPLGVRWLNLELSIAAYQLTLQVYSRETFSEDWATTQNNLAAAYTHRIRGDRAENIEQAITTYELALQVRTYEAFPMDWAMTQNNLATAYNNRIQGNWAENIEQAIKAYQQSLQVFTHEAFPEKWAMTQNNLANAYRGRTQGDQVENLELAIAAYELSLQVFTQEAFPEQWANTQSNLANAYSNRLRGDRAKNIEQAIGAYHQALQVLTPEAFPNDCRRTARSLGNLYFEQKNWSKAAEAYTLALQAAESLYQSTILLDSKAAELTTTGDLPRQAAYAYAQTGQLQQAVLILEQGRARGLSETLERDRADLVRLQQTHPGLTAEYQNVTTQLRNLEIQERQWMTSTDRYSLTPDTFRTTATQLRQQLINALTQIRQQPGYESFLTQPTFAEIQGISQAGNPLVYFVVTFVGSLVLIITPDGIYDLWLDTFNEADLRALLYGSTDEPELGGWFGAYSQSQANHQTWLEAIDQVTHQLWQPLMAPLINRLKQHNFQQATLIPT